MMTNAHFEWHDAAGDIKLATSGLTGVLCDASLLLERTSAKLQSADAYRR